MFSVIIHFQYYVANSYTDFFLSFHFFDAYFYDLCLVRSQPDDVDEQ